ncbi:hypothetical protein ACWDTT_15810 [Streptosporangium sandarakinum]
MTDPREQVLAELVSGFGAVDIYHVRREGDSLEFLVCPGWKNPEAQWFRAVVRLERVEAAEEPQELPRLARGQEPIGWES